MRSKRKLMIDQLDQRIRPFLSTRQVIVPERGWIHNIRTSLNMTMAQLGARLHITRQAVKKLEESEANGSISIGRLKTIAQALNLKLVYCLVPKEGTVDHMLQERAEQLARRIVLRTNQSMKLEAQGIGDEKLKDTIKDLADEIKRELRRSLWD